MLLGVHGQEDDARPGAGLEDLAGGVQSVQERHDQVEDGHVGIQGPRHPDRFLAIRGLCNHLEPFPLQEGPEPLADDLMVVCQEDSKRHFRGWNWWVP